MDKEMKNGMRELSMDEMDKVSGGTGQWVNGVYMDEGAINDYANVLINNYCYDVAAEMYCKTFGLSPQEIKACKRSGSDADSMSVLVYRHMQILDNLEKKGHSY